MVNQGCLPFRRKKKRSENKGKGGLPTTDAERLINSPDKNGNNGGQDKPTDIETGYVFLERSINYESSTDAVDSPRIDTIRNGEDTYKVTAGTLECRYPNICVQCGHQASPPKLSDNIHQSAEENIPEGFECQKSVLKHDFECQVSIGSDTRVAEEPLKETTTITADNNTNDLKSCLPLLSAEKVEAPVSSAAKRRSALLSVVKAVSHRPIFRVEDVVGDDGSLLNAAAVRKLLQKPSVKSYTSFLICLRKGSMKFIEQIIQECDAFQLMFDALAALSLKTIGSFTDTILQLEIVRAVKMVLNSKVGLNYLIEEERGFVSDLAYGRFPLRH